MNEDEFVQPIEVQPLVRYNPADREIKDLALKLSPLPKVIQTDEEYEQVRRGLLLAGKYRSAIEKQRVRAKADSLDWGRKVDAEAKRLTELVRDIENPLKAAKQLVDDRTAKAAREAQEAMERELARQAEEERKAKEAAERAAREAEQARLREEKERLDEERRQLQEQQDRLDAQRKELEREQRAAQEERLAAQRAEQARQDAIRAEAQRAAQEESDRLAAAQAVEERKAREAAEAAKAEALQPDAEKVRRFGQQLQEAIPTYPALTNDKAFEFMKAIEDQLTDLINGLKGFGR
jgi:chromosome segregation ATPase